tara:strand:+ start:331 stop:1362 length:1032 start_codon:yes stop_codon:yes gene_type:complete
MSTINTNGINVSYPVPGVNNNSQGFRNNFNAIKTNLDVAGAELSDLQTKAVVTSALANTTVNNDMANTLISNASTRGFRATTYNLGNALSGTVLINVALGDVQYGTVSGNVTFDFGSWAPAGTQSNVELQLSVSNSSAVITFPSQVVFANNNYGVTTVENFANVGNTPTITTPYGVSQLDYRLSSVDCGNTITIEPYNRPRMVTQVQQRTPTPTGYQGDVAGTFAVDANYFYVCTSTFASGGVNTLVKTASATTATGNLITLSDTTSLAVNKPIVFSGTMFGGLVANTPYYITYVSTPNIAVSATRIAGTAGANFALTTDSGTLTATAYLGSDIWKKTTLVSW